jgi:DNA-binding transcriptional MerR regulator
MEPTSRVREINGTFYTPERVDGLEFLRDWKRLNLQEYDHILDHQENERMAHAEQLRLASEEQTEGDGSALAREAEEKTR